MRTKLTILSAAALAAGLLSSHAQVYSANVVGYVNTSIPANNAFTLINNPLDASTNLITTVIPNPPAGLAILLWTGTGYAEYDYVGGAPGTQWYDVGNDDFADNTLLIPPGTGFFAKKPGAGVTNLTFVGTALVSTQTVSLVSGYNLVGSKIPVGTNAAGLNLSSAVAVNDYVLKWNGAGYSEFDYLGSGNWYDVGNDDIIAPTFNVGEGFFIHRSTGSATWTNILNLP